jgi:hypothetical protein
MKALGEWPNKPAAGNAGFAPGMAIGHHWPGVPEPARWQDER